MNSLGYCLQCFPDLLGRGLNDILIYWYGLSYACHGINHISNVVFVAHSDDLSLKLVSHWIEDGMK